MPEDYYEAVNISQDASTTEVVLAVDIQYNKWRQLVTHHDQSVVNQANEALQTLERIRETLTDPVKRAEYDASLGYGVAAGLADQSAHAAQSQPTPPALFPASANPSVSTPPPQALERTDAWICPKCQKANPVGVQFCQGCGNTIAEECPGCGKLGELTNKYCAYCGKDKEIAFQELQQKKIKDLQQQVENSQHNLAQIMSKMSSRKEFFKSENDSLGGNLILLKFFELLGAWFLSMTGALMILFLIGKIEDFQLATMAVTCLIIALVYVSARRSIIFNREKKVLRASYDNTAVTIQELETEINKQQGMTYKESI